VNYSVEISSRATRDLDRLSRDIQQRMMRRLEQLAVEPHSNRLSSALTNRGAFRKSRVGGWRIIFTVDDEKRTIFVVTVERRGQVYQRI
jgi:mRNA interferase RelE/StbE